MTLYNIFLSMVLSKFILPTSGLQCYKCNSKYDCRLSPSYKTCALDPNTCFYYEYVRRPYHPFSGKEKRGIELGCGNPYPELGNRYYRASPGFLPHKSTRYCICTHDWCNTALNCNRKPLEQPRRPIAVNYPYAKLPQTIQKPSDTSAIRNLLLLTRDLAIKTPGTLVSTDKTFTLDQLLFTPPESTAVTFLPRESIKILPEITESSQVDDLLSVETTQMRQAVTKPLTVGKPIAIPKISEKTSEPDNTAEPSVFDGEVKRPKNQQTLVTYFKAYSTKIFDVTKSKATQKVNSHDTTGRSDLQKKTNKSTDRQIIVANINNYFAPTAGIPKREIIQKLNINVSTDLSNSTIAALPNRSTTIIQLAQLNTVVPISENRSTSTSIPPPTSQSGTTFASGKLTPQITQAIRESHLQGKTSKPTSRQNPVANLSHVSVLMPNVGKPKIRNKLRINTAINISHSDARRMLENEQKTDQLHLLNSATPMSEGITIDSSSPSSQSETTITLDEILKFVQGGFRDEESTVSSEHKVNHFVQASASNQAESQMIQSRDGHRGEQSFASPAEKANYLPKPTTSNLTESPATLVHNRLKDERTFGAPEHNVNSATDAGTLKQTESQTNLIYDRLRDGRPFPSLAHKINSLTYDDGAQNHAKSNTDLMSVLKSTEKLMSPTLASAYFTKKQTMNSAMVTKNNNNTFNNTAYSIINAIIHAVDHLQLNESMLMKIFNDDAETNQQQTSGNHVKGMSVSLMVFICTVLTAIAVITVAVTVTVVVNIRRR